jgi:ssDNA-binding Zn-finger/Zn-ribbon topoisomerase 1
MRFPLTNCPNCNALERLARKEERIGDMIHAYTRCNTCRTVFPIETISADEQRRREKAERERRRQIRGSGAKLRSSRARPERS